MKKCKKCSEKLLAHNFSMCDKCEGNSILAVMIRASDERHPHGGKRQNAGRKPRNEGHGRTVGKSIKVSREIADYLAEFGTGIIEDTLRKSKAFREWKAKSG